MGQQSFFDNFALLADAPNGVPKLRELILQLAVEGKLVSQDSSDEPAAALLKRIEREKDKLALRTGDLPVSILDESEAPYVVPTTWRWTSLESVGLINPKNEFDDDEMASFVPMKLVPQSYGDQVRTETRPWKDIKKGFTHFAEGDVVLAKITPCFQNGKAAVMRGLENRIGAGTTELHVFRPLNDLMISEYVLIYLKSPKFLLDGVPRMTGTAGQKRVPNNYFAHNPFPLPPLEEQKRIVAKVHELMRLCDALEERQEDRRESCRRLNHATLASLNNAASLASEEFKQASTRLCDNFATLYDSGKAVAELRSTILQLAVQGKLLPQDASDEPTSALLENVDREKRRLIKEGKLSKKRTLPEINNDEEAFRLPENWAWVRMGDVVEQRLGKMLDKSKNKGNPFPYLRNTNVQWLRFDLSDVKEMRFENSELEEYEVSSGDLLICEGGEPGRCAIWEGQVKQIMFQKALHRIRPFAGIQSWFLLYRLLADAMTGSLEKHFTGATIKHFTGQELAKYVLGLPPLEEQKRIVAKVNQLMALCDELETKLRQAEADSEKLMNAAIQHVLQSIVSIRTNELAVAFT